MPWKYEQSTGKLLTPMGNPFAAGYSGAQPHVNDAAAQQIPDVGPIPAGYWEIGQPYDSPETGAYTLPLTRIAPTQTWGRDGFKIHGDSVQFSGLQKASKGCVILQLFARHALWVSADHVLSVVASL